jgi:hypothetical protein
MCLLLLHKKLNKDPENKRHAFRVVDMLVLFAVFWSIANNFLLAFNVFGGPTIPCSFMEVYYGTGTIVRVAIFMLLIYCDYISNINDQPTTAISKYKKKFLKTILKFNRLTLKAMIVTMCYALLMLQGKCEPVSTWLIISFAVLIAGTLSMVKVVAKYSSYLSAYYLKNMLTFGIASFTLIQFVSFYTEPDMPAINLLYFIAVCDFYAECADMCRSRCNAEDADVRANEKLAKELAKTGHSRESIQQAKNKTFQYDSDDDDFDEEDYDVEAARKRQSATIVAEMNPMNGRTN